MRKRIKSPTSEKEVVEAINEVSNALEEKQERLTAGQNITIDGNTISSKSELSFDYDTSYNKPSINGVDLIGDKSSNDLLIDTVFTIEAIGILPNNQYIINDSRLPNNNNFKDGMSLYARFDSFANSSTLKINEAEALPFVLWDDGIDCEVVDSGKFKKGTIYQFKFINNKWLLVSPELQKKWENVSSEIEASPVENLKTIAITSANMLDGFVYLVLTCEVSKALTAGSYLRANISLGNSLNMVSLCSGSSLLGRSVITGILNTDGLLNIEFTGADYGADAVFDFAINIPVQKI